MCWSNEFRVNTCRHELESKSEANGSKLRVLRRPRNHGRNLLVTAAAISTDSAYHGLNADDVVVTNLDNDGSTDTMHVGDLDASGSPVELEHGAPSKW